MCDVCVPWHRRHAPPPQPPQTPPTPNCGCEATDVFSPTAQMEAQLSVEKRRLATTLQQILEAPTDPASLSSGRSQPQPDSSQFHAGPSSAPTAPCPGLLLLAAPSPEARSVREPSERRSVTSLHPASRQQDLSGGTCQTGSSSLLQLLGRERRHVCLATFRFTFPLSAWRDGSF